MVFKNVLDLSERLSSKQVARLKAAGIRTLYDLITYLPIGVYRILPLSKFDREAIDRPRYLDQAILQKVIEKQTRRRFLLLEWHSQVTNWTYQTYFFSLLNLPSKA